MYYNVYSYFAIFIFFPVNIGVNSVDSQLKFYGAPVPPNCIRGRPQRVMEGEGQIGDGRERAKKE